MKVNEARFWKWFDQNMVYCVDTHSFVHRLFTKNKKEKWTSYHAAQCDAWAAIAEMRKEFAEKKVQRQPR